MLRKEHGRECFATVDPLPSPPPSLPLHLSPEQPYSTCKKNKFCMAWTTAELEALPVLTFHMDGGVEVNVRPEAYMDASPHEENAYSPR